MNNLEDRTVSGGLLDTNALCWINKLPYNLRTPLPPISPRRLVWRFFCKLRTGLITRDIALLEC